MGTILMNIDTFCFFAIDVSAEVRALVNNEASLTATSGKAGKGAAEEAGADYEVIVFRHRTRFQFSRVIYWASQRS